VRRIFPDFEAIYAAKGWRMFPSLDRVYVNAAARRDLGWRPKHDFRRALDCLARGEEFGSDLARVVGSKGYSG
jgi:UDP-glucose 4-epimerase